MADPVGLVASVIAILEVTAAISSYASAVYNAPATLRTLLTEITTLQNVLSSLRDFAEAHPSTLLKSGIDTPLRDAAIDLNCLKEKLYHKGATTRTGKVVERMKWPLRERETDIVMGKIEKLRCICLLAMAMDQMFAYILEFGEGQSTEVQAGHFRRRLRIWL